MEDGAEDVYTKSDLIVCILLSFGSVLACWHRGMTYAHSILQIW